MKLYMYMYFMFLFIFFKMNWSLFQFMILFISLIIFFFSKFNFFSLISYNCGLDFYSYGLIVLSMLIICLMIISSNLIKNSFLMNYFLMVNLILCVSLVLLFSTMNMLMLYLYFEFSLLPLLILIYTWGYQPERLISGLYLLFYTLFASLPFLLVIIYFNNNNMSMFFDTNFIMLHSFMLHVFMIFAFVVKLPMFMVHFWLPKAHVQAPVSGSMILAGLMLKIGGYGFIRFLSINELMFVNYGYIWYSLSIIGCVLVSLICLLQGDIKCLIAYSSVAHMGMCLIGLMSMFNWGLFGSYLMMISHGFCSSALFCLANFSYERFSSRSFFLGKGLINFMPSMSLFWFVFCCFNMSCPPSLNFLSEILIINSMMMYWHMSFYYFFFISLFSACFSYYLYSYIQHGMPHLFYCYSLGVVREYLLMAVHLFPLVILVLMINFIY
uniref:NADH-ubiquinone oxidoreductase chain 4 n=1 Tax=Bolanusoides shaanxiensis TaxID=2691008 RepID=A0A6B9LU21_9HEMI|nr:NADH dehydrogenase subunit 4 [Bolanusoides shaanxiensis]